MDSKGMQYGKLRVAVVDLRSADALAALEWGIVPEADRVIFFSDEWENRRVQCEAFVRAQAGLFERRVGARACTIREVPKAESVAFLKAYHLQAASYLSLTSFGLYHGEELVGVLSMGRHNRQNGENKVVLDRLCFAPGVQVVGGSSRLFAAAQSWARENGYDEIVSFSDYRLTPGTVYERLGFELDRVYRPDYFYVHEGRRISKQSQQKRCTGCPVDVTERTWALDHGLVRCCDAGKKRWVFNLRPGEHRMPREANSERTAKLHAAGAFKNAHMRGYFQSAKNAGDVYFGSSYELRCLFELEENTSVRAFRRCEAFRGSKGWRNPDLRVEFVDGHSEIWEVKPFEMTERPEVKVQIADSSMYASKMGVPFRVWTEQDSELKTCNAIMKWAHSYLAEQQGDHDYADRRKTQRKAIQQRHYAKEQAASVVVACAYCGCEHTVLPRTYARNIAKHDGVYVCEAMAGHIGGSKPKDHLKKTNPYAAEGRKECSMCKAVLPVGEFQKRAKSWDGLSAACKPCLRVYDAARYQARKANTSSC